MKIRMKKIGDDIVSYHLITGEIVRIGSESVTYDSNGRLARVGNKAVYYKNNEIYLIGKEEARYKDGILSHLGDRPVSYEPIPVMPQPSEPIAIPNRTGDARKASKPFWEVKKIEPPSLQENKENEKNKERKSLSN